MIKWEIKNEYLVAERHGDVTYFPLSSLVWTLGKDGTLDIASFGRTVEVFANDEKLLNYFHAKVACDVL